MGQLTLWVANTIQAIRIIGIGMVAIGVLVVGMRFIFSVIAGNEHQNVLARSGVIPLIAGSIIIIASTGALDLLYAIAGVAAPK